MHLLVILLQQLLGMLPSKQPVPQAEVIRPRQAEPRNSDSASFAGYKGAGFYGAGYEAAWGYWTNLPMLEAKEIRAPWGAEFHRWRKPAGTVPREPSGLNNPGGIPRQGPGESMGHFLSTEDSFGER